MIIQINWVFFQKSKVEIWLKFKNWRLWSSTEIVPIIKQCLSTSNKNAKRYQNVFKARLPGIVSAVYSSRTPIKALIDFGCNIFQVFSGKIADASWIRSIFPQNFRFRHRHLFRNYSANTSGIVNRKRIVHRLDAALEEAGSPFVLVPKEVSAIRGLPAEASAVLASDVRLADVVAGKVAKEIPVLTFHVRNDAANAARTVVERHGSLLGDVPVLEEASSVIERRPHVVGAAAGGCALAAAIFPLKIKWILSNLENYDFYFEFCCTPIRSYCNCNSSVIRLSLEKI